MPRWILYFTPEAEGDLARLDVPARRRILERLAWLERNFSTIDPAPLGGTWRGFFKFRVGNRRVLYKISWDAQELWVIMIDARDRVYKRR